MNVLVTGGTGFVGRYMLEELLEAGHHIKCIARSLPETARENSDIEWITADITNPASIAGAFSDVDAVVHLVGIIEEQPSRNITFESIHVDGTRNVVEAARSAGVTRWIHMSANGAGPDGASAYQTSKYEAEQIVRNAGFDHYTIFRPSIVFGRPAPGQPEFCTQIYNTLLKPFPVWPVFGDGTYALRPVAVQNVATVFVGALTREQASGKTYCVAGKQKYEYVEILRRIARGGGIKPRPMIRQPLFVARPIVKLLGGTVLPVTIDQLDMLVSGNTCDPSAMLQDFDVNLIPFTPDNLTYVAGESQ